MRLFAYILILLALSAALIKGLAVAITTALLGKDLLIREYEVRRCGRFLALQRNLHASVSIIAHYQPHDFERERLLAAIANFTANYKIESCMDAKLGLRVEVYRHDNPMLPDFWANYAFRFVAYKPTVSGL